ncbi:unnamed protein product, partial [Linum tenue]
PIQNWYAQLRCGPLDTPVHSQLNRKSNQPKDSNLCRRISRPGRNTRNTWQESLLLC